MLHAKTRLFAAIVILSNLFGNFFLSWGLKLRGSALGGSVVDYITVIFNPWVSLGICLLIIWLLSRMALLSWADLSYVLPVTSIGYVLNALMGKFFLAEEVSPQRWLGTLLIFAGMWLVSSTAIRTTADSEHRGQS